MENKLVVTSGRGHGEGQYGARILKATNYWVGQNVHSGSSVPSCRKTQTNFLANPIRFKIFPVHHFNGKIDTVIHCYESVQSVFP